MVEFMIKKLISENIQYNLLSLVNVFAGFLFVLFLGRKFGAGSETDIYFLSLVTTTYLGYFIQSVWEAMSPYYVERKTVDKKKSDELYSILLNDLILVSLLIITIYFIVTPFFDFLSNKQKDFFNVFIFYLLFQNVLLFNKTILNLEHFYASYYLVDIFVYIILFATILFFVDTEILYIAYATLIATFIANIWQFYLLHKKLNINYYFIFYNKDLKEVYKNSFKLKIGSLLYGSKDIIIASVFTNFGSGMFSLYSYANKFAGVILQVVNAPIINIFATRANYYVANRRYDLLKNDIKKVLFQTTVLFSLFAVSTYFVLPYLLLYLFDDKFTCENIVAIQFIFLAMSIFNLILVIQSPYGRLMTIFRMFNKIITVNVVFIGVLILIYLVFNVFKLNYLYFLIGLVFCQIVQSSIIYVYFKKVFQ